jgi:hypothetical protein
VSRRTEDDEAAELLADLKNRGFRICESKPKTDATYLEGSDAAEWLPIDDKRAKRLIAALLMLVVQ